MSCGVHLEPHRRRADPEAAITMFKLSARPSEVFASLWDDPVYAEESCRLNRDNHGHDAYGPVRTEDGWLTAVDITDALLRSRGAQQ